MLLEEENLHLRNQITENHKTICKMQNVSNTRKHIQAKPEEINVPKSVDNGEILTLDNESMSDETLWKKLIYSRSIEEQMIEFRRKNREKYLEYKGYSAKAHDKDESILSPICTNETDINDNVHLTIVKTTHDKRAPLYVSLMIQFPHVCRQACYSKTQS